MSENLGPILSIHIMVILSLPLFLSVEFWLVGHFCWLVLNNGIIPNWLSVWLKLHMGGSLEEIYDNIKPSHVYLNKGIAWGINILWYFLIVFVLVPRNLDNYPYEPIFGHTPLSHLGGAVFELLLFLIITGVIRWFPWSK